MLRGEKAVTIEEAARVLDACGISSNGALLLAILGNEDLAVEWLGEDVGAFLDQFLAAPPRLIRLPEVIARVGLKRSSIYQRMAEGRFPKGRSLGPRCAVWVESEIDA
jgi:predicted DNA-binding transcriptional regulator AlpA